MLFLKNYTCLILMAYSYALDVIYHSRISAIYPFIDNDVGDLLCSPAGSAGLGSGHGKPLYGTWQPIKKIWHSVTGSYHFHPFSRS